MQRELAAMWAAADKIFQQMKNNKLSEKSTSIPWGFPSWGIKHTLSKPLEDQEEEYEAEEKCQNAQWSAAVPARYTCDRKKNSDFEGHQCRAAFTSTNEYSNITEMQESKMQQQHD